jgi:hypothetical protein
MDYANQFLAEELRKDRRGTYYWKQTGKNNHLLDAEVYAAACTDASWFPSLMQIVNTRKSRQAAVKTVNEKRQNNKNNGSIEPSDRW